MRSNLENYFENVMMDELKELLEPSYIIKKSGKEHALKDRIDAIFDNPLLPNKENSEPLFALTKQQITTYVKEIIRAHEQVEKKTAKFVAITVAIGIFVFLLEEMMPILYYIVFMLVISQLIAIGNAMHAIAGIPVEFAIKPMGMLLIYVVWVLIYAIFVKIKVTYELKEHRTNIPSKIEVLRNLYAQDLNAFLCDENDGI